jgi:DNA-binding NarL/FixJ family response regulator
MDMKEKNQDEARIRLVLADDHRILLDGLAYLMGLEEGFEVVCCCTSGQQALKEVREMRPDVLILDLVMPGMDGLHVLRELQAEALATRVILLADELTEDDMLEAMRLGVRGIILKEMGSVQLMQCVRKVHAGGEWLEKKAAARALERVLRREYSAQQLSQSLTARELQMVKMVANGLSNKETARKLSITEGTVKIHLHNIYQKLEVKGRMQLMLYAQKEGLAEEKDKL